MNKTYIAFAAIALSTMAFTTACSSSGGSASEASPAESSSMVGGMTTCDEATITKAIQDVQAAESPDDQVFAVDNLNCADGWAVAEPTVGTNEDDAITYTQIFQAEGQFWIPKLQEDVCGTRNESDSTAYPADAAIPEALFDEGCNTN